MVVYHFAEDRWAHLLGPRGSSWRCGYLRAGEEGVQGLAVPPHLLPQLALLEEQPLLLRPLLLQHGTALPLHAPPRLQELQAPGVRLRRVRLRGWLRVRGRGGRGGHGGRPVRLTAQGCRNGGRPRGLRSWDGGVDRRRLAGGRPGVFQRQGGRALGSWTERGFGQRGGRRFGKRPLAGRGGTGERSRLGLVGVPGRDAGGARGGDIGVAALQARGAKRQIRHRPMTGHGSGPLLRHHSGRGKGRWCRGRRGGHAGPVEDSPRGWHTERSCLGRRKVLDA